MNNTPLDKIAECMSALRDAITESQRYFDKGYVLPLWKMESTKERWIKTKNHMEQYIRNTDDMYKKPEDIYKNTPELTRQFLENAKDMD